MQTKQQIPLKKTSLRKPIYYGWIVVFIASLGVFFSGPGQTYSISIFIDYYIADFGWSRSMVSGYYSMATLMAGLLLFVVGRLVDKYGQRTMMTAVGFLLGIASFWNSAITGPVMLFIGFFMLRLFGQGSMTLLPSTLVPQWFFLKRGRALSFMAIGGFISSALVPPVNTWMIQSWGWPMAWKVWGILLMFIFVPLSYYFVRNKPEDMGLLPDNSSLPTKEMHNREAKQPVYEVNWTLKEAMKTKTFWLVIFCVAIPPLVNTGITFHLISILGGKGVSPFTAALVLSIMALVGFPTSLAVGFLLERIKTHTALACTFIALLVAILLLLNVHSPATAIIFGIAWGIALGFERITMSIIWPNYFGLKNLGSIKGLAMTTTVIGSALGPLPLALAYDHLFNGYNEALLAFIVLAILGAIAAFNSPQPMKNHA